MIEPRIIPREQLGPAVRVTRSTDPRATCRHTIVLGGTTYRCGRETIGIDADRGIGHHEGIHDAFADHAGGAVRW